MLAAGFDRALGALTVIHTDGKIVQYLDGEWLFVDEQPSPLPQ